MLSESVRLASFQKLNSREVFGLSTSDALSENIQPMIRGQCTQHKQELAQRMKKMALSASGVLSEWTTKKILSYFSIHNFTKTILTPFSIAKHVELNNHKHST